MPETFECKVRGSVREALHHGWQEVLPDTIRQSPGARWVLNFDSLGNPVKSRDVRAPDLERRDFDGRLRWVVKHLLGPAVEQRVQFYFVSLFRIGRQWRISELAIKSLATALESKELPSISRPSTELLSSIGIDPARYSLFLDASPDELSSALRIVLRQALERHRSIFRVTQGWWSAWQKEVDALRQSVGEANELVQSYGYRHPEHEAWRLFDLIAEVGLPTDATSRLYMEMHEAGLEYTATRDARSFVQEYGSFVFLGLSLLGTDFARSPLFERWLEQSLRGEEYKRNLEEQKLEEARQQRMRPYVEIALNNLTAKYGNKSPFEEFGVLQKSANRDLYDLVRENILPNRSESPWLEAWKSRLQPEMKSYQAVRADYDSTEPEVLQSFVGSADVAVKRGLTTKGLDAGETWQQFVQRLFEKQWIDLLASNMANSVKDATNEAQSARRGAFSKLIGGVVGAMQKSGYPLIVPSEKRLDLLWSIKLSGKWSSEW